MRIPNLAIRQVGPKDPGARRPCQQSGLENRRPPRPEHLEDEYHGVTRRYSTVWTRCSPEKNNSNHVTSSVQSSAILRARLASKPIFVHP